MPMPTISSISKTTSSTFLPSFVLSLILIIVSYITIASLTIKNVLINLNITLHSEQFSTKLRNN